MKKILKWGGIALVVLIIIGIISGNKSGNTSTSSSSNTANSGQDTKQEEVKVAGLNETVQDDDLAFTVTGVDKEQVLGNQFTQKTAQGTFYVISLKVENTGNKTVTFNTSQAKVVDSKNREFEYSIDGQTAKGMAQGHVDLFLQQIQPSLSVSGDLVFDLPTDIKNPVLVLKGGLFSQGVKIKLD